MQALFLICKCTCFYSLDFLFALSVCTTPRVMKAHLQSLFDSSNSLVSKRVGQSSHQIWPCDKNTGFPVCFSAAVVFTAAMVSKQRDFCGGWSQDQLSFFQPQQSVSLRGCQSHLPTISHKPNRASCTSWYHTTGYTLFAAQRPHNTTGFYRFCARFVANADKKIFFWAGNVSFSFSIYSFWCARLCTLTVLKDLRMTAFWRTLHLKWLKSLPSQ